MDKIAPEAEGQEPAVEALKVLWPVSFGEQLKSEN